MVDARESAGDDKFAVYKFNQSDFPKFSESMHLSEHYHHPAFGFS